MHTPTRLPPLAIRRMYDADDVDAYVDDLRPRLARMRAELRYSLARSHGDSGYDRDEAMAGRTLLIAQQVANETIKQAQADARSLLARARQQAALVLAEGRSQTGERDRLEGDPARRGGSARRPTPRSGVLTQLDPTAPWAAGPADDAYFAELRRALDDDYSLGPVPEPHAPSEQSSGLSTWARSLAALPGARTGFAS